MDDLIKSIKKVEKFLTKNNFKNCGFLDEYVVYEHKLIHIHINHEEIVFIDDSGDFLHIKINYYTLLGVLIHFNILDKNFKRLN